MSIPWSGATQSNGVPGTYYEYRAEYSNRTEKSIRVKLQIRLRMQWYSSYYSFRIAHECKVNGVYQYADIKTTRRFWGHQWEGSYYGGGEFYWQAGDYNYDGTNWHGWYTVFDGNVPIGLDDDTVEIVPCITQPPITGLGQGGIYATNYQDITNWEGRRGVWRPFGSDEMRGSYKSRACPEDGCWLNNRNVEGLSGGLKVGKYQRPANASGIVLSPSRIDVAEQDSRAVTGSWGRAQRASGYRLYLSKSSSGASSRSIGSVSRNSATFHPRIGLKLDEMVDGDEVYLGVRPYDSNGVESTRTVWGGPARYFEAPSEAPDEAYLVGRNGEPNRILYKGERAVLHYSGESDGSYPIETFELHRKSDGASVRWARGNASESADAAERLVSLSIPGVERPNVVERWELRAYNTKGRPVYKEDGTWLEIEVDYYGGVVFVHDAGWHEGICWVYSGGSWHEAEAVYVRKGGEWKTL